MYLKCQEEKKEVVICSRVHPGETNASWIMKGMLDFLLSDHEIAITLRKKFIFRMVPMLNPDGVRYGNYRCCLFGNDLNRKWKKALEFIHTPIHSIKELMKKIQLPQPQESTDDISTTTSQSSQSQNQKSSKKVELFCDIHGHSKSMGAFIYGCFYKSDDETQENLYKQNNYKEMNNSIKRKDYFSFEKCSFAVQKDKLGTARIVGFQELSIPKSYTLECSFLGFKNPSSKINIIILQQMKIML